MKARFSLAETLDCQGDAVMAFSVGTASGRHYYSRVEVDRCKVRRLARIGHVTISHLLDEPASARLSPPFRSGAPRANDSRWEQGVSARNTPGEFKVLAQPMRSSKATFAHAP